MKANHFRVCAAIAAPNENPSTGIRSRRSFFKRFIRRKERRILNNSLRELMQDMDFSVPQLLPILAINPGSSSMI
jgi:hypothetical protein